MKKLITLLSISILIGKSIFAQTALNADEIKTSSAKISWVFNLEPDQNIYQGVACPSSELAAFTTASGKTPAKANK